MLIFQIKRVISSEKWFNYVVTSFFENAKIWVRRTTLNREKKRGWPKLPIVQMTMTCVQLFQRHFNNSIFSTYITIGVKSLFNFLMYENPSSAGHKNISSTSKSGKNVSLSNTFTHKALGTKALLSREDSSLMNKLMRVE